MEGRPVRGDGTVLIPNWRKVLRRAWSVRFLALAGICDFVSWVWPSLIGDNPPVWLTLAGSGFVIAALAARFVLQPEMHDDPPPA